LLERLPTVPDTVESVMLSGHNPGLQELALDLARQSARVRELATKYPTATLARLELSASSWQELDHDKAGSSRSCDRATSTQGSTGSLASLPSVASREREPPPGAEIGVSLILQEQPQHHVVDGQERAPDAVGRALCLARVGGFPAEC
jgi:hypothetical protein